jgi:hypothetical protein
LQANNYEKYVHSAAKFRVVAMERSKCNNKESVTFVPFNKGGTK